MFRIYLNDSYQVTFNLKQCACAVKMRTSTSLAVSTVH